MSISFNKVQRLYLMINSCYICYLYAICSCWWWFLIQDSSLGRPQMPLYLFSGKSRHLSVSRITDLPLVICTTSSHKRIQSTCEIPAYNSESRKMFNICCVIDNRFISKDLIFYICKAKIKWNYSIPENKSS